ncbi:TPA: hypothetical protein N0F65_003151 [Lagenidium giganteum]|uniref:TIR domain-containing protein n=1 Tax=Lagenidium giganteum TaxID=4803 RepID=A0AAV2YGW1_9STRA|nr:TPA: hypothetical protein N0F65_003151 [Lagenidium giganteum]
MGSAASTVVENMVARTSSTLLKGADEVGLVDSVPTTDATAPSTFKSVLFICHSSRKKLPFGFIRDLTGQEIKCLVVVTEESPRDLQTRAEVLATCDVAVVGVDGELQHSTKLIDTISFLKDSRKQVVAGPIDFYSRPSGAIGAICGAFGRWDASMFEPHGPFGEMLRTERWKFLVERDIQGILQKARSTEAINQLEAQDRAIEQQAASEGGLDKSILFVCCDELGQGIVTTFQSIQSHGMAVNGTTYVVACDGPVEHDMLLLARVRTVAFVITERWAQCEPYRRLFEAALRWGKPILPINAKTRMSGWLALAMAGRLWYEVNPDRMDDIFKPYASIPDCPCKLEDSSLAVDFIMCVNGILSSPSRVLEATQIKSRERALLQLSKERAQVLGLDVDTMDEVCAKAKELVETKRRDEAAWEELGVLTTSQAIERELSAPLLYPDPVELLPKGQAIQMSNIHYTTTRMTCEPPPSVLDDNGLPIPNLQLDAMFSYQWGSQQTVLGIHHQAQVHSVRSWFDVFGHMQGNVNSAMAAAVENVACVAVFLTEMYVKSINCKLEFQYAAKCRRPIILALLEDVQSLPDWITAVTGTDFNIYPNVIRSNGRSRVFALNMNVEYINGVPTVDCLFGAIRKFAAMKQQVEGLPVVHNGSLLLYATTSALRHAVLHPQATAVPVTINCTRCGAPFNPNVPSSLSGCRKHSAYYVGGTIIAGRWVCCQETSTTGVGCHPAMHTTVQREWTIDGYGCHTWQPE